MLIQTTLNSNTVDENAMSNKKCHSRLVQYFIERVLGHAETNGGKKYIFIKYWTRERFTIYYIKRST